MTLNEFLKNLPNKEAVDGYEISKLEVNVMDFNHEPDENNAGLLHICCPEMAMAKIAITPKEKENG